MKVCTEREGQQGLTRDVTSSLSGYDDGKHLLLHCLSHAGKPAKWCVALGQGMCVTDVIEDAS